MALFNISAILSTHAEVDQRLHNLSHNDGGLAHQHRRILLDVLQSERKNSGAVQLQAQIQELSGKLRQAEEQLAGLREVAGNATKEAAERRAELGAARRTINNLKADISKLDPAAGQHLQHAVHAEAGPKQEVAPGGKPFPAGHDRPAPRRVPADLLPEDDDFGDPVTAPLLRPPGQ